jgi:beta-galactosidase
MGNHVHYYFNYSPNNVKFTYGYGAGTGLIRGTEPTHGQEIALGPWDLAIIEEH